MGAFAALCLQLGMFVCSFFPGPRRSWQPQVAHRDGNRADNDCSAPSNAAGPAQSLLYLERLRRDDAPHREKIGI